MAEENKNHLALMVKQKQEDLWVQRPKYFTDSMDAYFKRTLMAVAENDDLMKLSQNKVGAQSLLMCIGKALRVGLQIGGIMPQAYITVMGNKAVLIPDARGFRHIVKTRPDILKDFIINIVYDGDDCKIDRITGEVHHIAMVTDKPRKLIGVYAIFTNPDGTKTADFMSRGDIEKIRDNWSPQPNGKAWTKAFDQMAVAKATKRFLKPYASEIEGLAMALEIEDEQPDYIEPETEIEVPVESEDGKLFSK